LFSSDKAIFRVIPEGSLGSFEDLVEAIPHEIEAPPLTGSIVCPRGCGARIYWVLAADVSEFLEQYLLYLHQQLSWTACKDHNRYQPLNKILMENGWNPLPPRSPFDEESRYSNLYE
jgi:hypothetical protein